MKTFFALTGSIIGAVLLGFGVTALDYGQFKFWAPKYENAKREVFVNTSSYVNGKTEYLTHLRAQYEAAEAGSASKASLRTLILEEASSVDTTKLSVGLQAFISTLQESK